MTLQDWCLKNNLSFSEESGGKVVINSVSGHILQERDQFFYVEDENLILDITDKERKILESYDIVILFFGGVWCYIKVGDYKNSKLVPLKYLGTKDDEKQYINLGVNGAFSIGEGSISYNLWVEKAGWLGHTHLGIAEKNLAGAIEFNNSCLAKNIQPIFGISLPLKLPNHQDPIYFKFFALSEIGWKNLISLNNFYYLDQKETPLYLGDISRFSLDIIIVIGRWTNLDIGIVDFCTKNFKNVYWEFDLSIPINEERQKTEIELFQNYLKYKNSHNLKPILLTNSFYLDEEDREIKKLLAKICDIGFFISYAEEHYKLYNELEVLVQELFKDKQTGIQFLQESIQNQNIFKQVDFKIKSKGFIFPVFESGEILKKLDLKSNEELFEYLIWEGYRSKKESGKLETDIKYAERIEEELGVIKEGGFENYFLILWDIIQFCDRNDILINFGRGSAAGSFISFLLGITKFNPFDYDLLFSRFLNRGRIKVSAPDIDLDCSSRGRDKIYQYLKDKYGDNNFCSIGAYKNFKVRAGFRDLASKKRIKSQDLIWLSKNMSFPEGKDGVWIELFKNAITNKALKEFINQHPDVAWNLYYLLNGAKTVSIHPCATIITPKEMDIKSTIPLRYNDEIVVSQWEGEYMDKMGFLKEDLLRLLQLDKVEDILKLIKEQTGDDVDIYNLPLKDEKVFNLFKLGYTSDVFQFASKGLTQFCKDAKPDSVEELILMVAMFRPGSIQAGSVLDYIKIKNKKKQVHFGSGLKEITKETFGLLVYQEQIMQICRELGGFNEMEADEVRRAMGKKQLSAILPYKERFLENYSQKGGDIKEGEKLWQDMLGFSDYAFNKSHSAAYSLLSYATQWLKYYYPFQFWTVILQYAKKEDINRYISEIKAINSGIKLKSPDINKSLGKEFTTDFLKKEIYFSLGGISRIGDVGLESFLKEREDNGSFMCFADFWERGEDISIDRGGILNLIYAGAFDEIEGVKKPIDRLKIAQQLAKEYKLSIEKLLKVEKEEYEKNYFWTLKEKEVTEIEHIDFKEILDETEFSSKKYIRGIELTEDREGESVVVCGVISDVREQNTKKGDRFAFVNIINENELITLIFWATEYQKFKDKLVLSEIKDRILISEGRINVWNGKMSVHINKFSKLKIL